MIIYYGPSVISVIVTKGGYLRGSRLYKTSKTIRRGVRKCSVRGSEAIWSLQIRTDLELQSDLEASVRCI